MTHHPLPLILAAGAAALLLGACDQSRQTADGSTKPGDAGTAAIDRSTVADTGSPEQGGANGTGPTGVQAAGGTLNQQEKRTTEVQTPPQPHP